RQVETIDLPWNDIHLEIELWDPERVNNVRRDQLEAYGLVHRKVQIGDRFRGTEVVYRFAADRVFFDVAECPLPLASHDRDRVVGVFHLVQYSVLRLCGVEEENRHGDDRRDRVQGFDRQVIANLAGNLISVAFAVPEHGPQDQAEDEQQDDESGDPSAQP